MSDKPSMKDVLDHYGIPVRMNMASCPWHQDRQASLSVSFAKQLWKCHSCGEHGDSYTFIMKQEGCDFRGAVAFAESLGMKVEEEDTLSGNRFTGKHKVTARDGKGKKKKFRMRFANG